ncbi:phosphate butyryltransferase [Dethiosulfatibacter aminovorans DSM 17477]|uniref:Phosphate butyryltransferase n=1 Tax=Dethiosulfatibacter aminovorans DSM 17477 TaxID=1121476 RepID=A0A1M6LI70_9FIRM|nr:phosphate butyryltransferase [Dethiosulfatibacter aminovorans]SHJ70889.1 phosphate butyryltransferase [Dethiosulfatibacter aminovorans DSM 17477]
MKDFNEVIEHVKSKGKKTLSVAAANDKGVLMAVKAAVEKGIVKPILVGREDEIRKISEEIGFELDGVEVIDVEDIKDASLKAVELVSSKKADFLMKGMVDTSILLKAVLDKEVGLRTGKTLSHVAVFFAEKYHKMLIITDAAMNIAPDLDKKREILENSVEFAHSLGIDNPKCAVVCAKEKVNPAMIHTVDAGELVKLNEEGQIKGCIVGGPFALDNAISKEAAIHKGIDHEVAGDADILLMPNIEAGNILYKALSFMSNSESAGVILGAAAPIVLTSRADSEEAKLNSIALAAIHS